MARIAVIHWNEDELRERLTRVRRAGHVAVGLGGLGGAVAGRTLAAHPPDAVLIDLGRLPSHGREMGIYLRTRKPTRSVPLVFVDGDPAKVARVRAALPDATYTRWSGIRGALTRALRQPPADPIVPRDVMAGYSGTPLPKKLGIKSTTKVALIGAPADFERTLGTLPEGATVAGTGRGTATIVMLFAKRRADLARRFAAAARRVNEGGSLWIAWPKQASGRQLDLTEADVRRFGLDAGWVDFKIAAIDATWSGLRFARRKPKRQT